MKYKFFKDIFRDQENGKYSSKKIWGSIIMFLVCSVFVLDGLKFYKANVELFNSMLTAGCILLGLRIVGGLFNKKKDGEE